MKRISFILMVGLMMMGTQNFAQTAIKSVKNVGVPEFSELMSEKNVVLLDVRSPREFVSGKIDGAINLPLNKISSEIGKLDKSKKYLVYCRSGARSRRAASFLAKNGFEVYNLSRGYLSWMRAKQ